MIKRTCKQCGKEFILSDSEIKFFKSRNLNLPKRCKDCRSANKESKQETQQAAVTVTDTNESKAASKKAANNRAKIGFIIAFIVLFIIGALVTGKFDKFFDPASNPIDSEYSYPTDDYVVEDEQTPPVATVTNYTFRNNDLYESHFDKHGSEVGAKTKEEYLAMANAVISNPDVLSKLETDDGDNDTVYFLEATGEFVVLSSDGYIRTYYISDLAYFNRQ